MGEAMPTAPAIRLSLGEPGAMLIRPGGLLSKPHWSSLTRAMRDEGCSYESGAHRADIDRVLPIVGRLRAAGFALSLSSDLAGEIAGRASAMRARVEEHQACAAAMNAALEPRGLEVAPYQAEGVAWLRGRSVGLLADDQGLGKTIQALLAIPERASGVVACPSAAVGVWRMEGYVWRPDLRFTVLDGRRAFRWPRPGEFVIVSWDSLPEVDLGAVPQVNDFPPDPPDGLVVIGDEYHVCKGAKTQRARRWRVLAAASRVANGRCWPMTGSPLLNKPRELWDLLNHAGLATEAFGSWEAYAALWDDNTAKPEFSEAFARVCLRRLKRDVLPDLKNPTYEDRIVDMHDEPTRQLCSEVQRMLEARGIDLDRAVSTAFAGGSFELISRLRVALAASMIPAMLEWIEEQELEGNDSPLVVFSAHRAPIDLLADRPGWEVITGDVSPIARAALQRRFQAGQLRGLGITIGAGGVALTLTRAHRVLFVDEAWTPGLNKQAVDRVNRWGQRFPVRVWRLVAKHPLCVRVAELLQRKLRMIESSIDKAAVSVGHHSARLIADAAALEALLNELPIAAPAAPSVRQVPKVRRFAESTVEQMIGAALPVLARSPAVHRADRGFLDSLASQLDRGLTPRQWGAAAMVVGRYRDVLKPSQNNHHAIS